ncbi:EamA family transporter [Planctomicrobium piriforme]|uniref:Transporter family protein n=1 Tax=Planctomicrobium piriforme TaxID=1576369 RepID=A0A1I3N6G1_9PLAN|nr:EamA family transporter [Planctomicrobium piriforme]SFJ04853.1 transporter family protein [Planctomicrobium piriforme]
MNWFSWALLSAFFAGITAILAKVGTASIEPNLAMALRTTVVLVFAWSIVWLIPAPAQAAISSRGILFLVLSGLATGASWLCYFRALHLGKASSVAPVDKLSVVFAIFLAALFLHEPVTWRHWLGAALIVTGSMVIAIK